MKNQYKYGDKITFIDSYSFPRHLVPDSINFSPF